MAATETDRAALLSAFAYHAAHRPDHTAYTWTDDTGHEVRRLTIGQVSWWAT
jgi:acyl-CoA synthetase (AMP-forming)/AMP-acid ligase II